MTDEEATEFHVKSTELTWEADLLVKKARGMYKEAYELKLKAANGVKSDKAKSLLLAGAAFLAFEADLFEESKAIVEKLLNDPLTTGYTLNLMEFLLKDIEYELS